MCKRRVLRRNGDTAPQPNVTREKAELRMVTGKRWGEREVPWVSEGAVSPELRREPGSS